MIYEQEAAAHAKLRQMKGDVLDEDLKLVHGYRDKYGSGSHRTHGNSTPIGHSSAIGRGDGNDDGEDRGGEGGGDDAYMLDASVIDAIDRENASIVRIELAISCA